MQDAGIHNAVFARAEAAGSRSTAIILADQTLGYGEMADRARRLSAALCNSVTRRPARIGILSARNEVSCIAILAILHAGMTFVPLNIGLPAAALVRIAAATDLDALVVGSESVMLAAQLIDRATSTHVFLVSDDIVPACLSAAQVVTRGEIAALAPGPAAPTRSGDVAYILSTSGTTGDPKGIPITHGNLRAFLDWAQDRYAIGPQDRLTQLFSHSFDLAIFDLFMAWRNGAAISLIDTSDPRAIVTRLRRDGVTSWFSVPSLVTQMSAGGALEPGCLSGLRLALFCGEPLTHGVARILQSSAPDAVIDNLYGPTELTLACTVSRWADPGPAVANGAIVPIGSVFPHLSALVIGPDGRALAAGQPGELAIGGVQLFGGYWRAPQLDEGKFIVSDDGVRHYRTGDTVVKRDDELHFIGRTDDQIKIRGQRIELGDVESALRHAGAIEAVALPWPDRQQPIAIRALVTGPAPQEQIVAALADLLPPVMRPARVVVVDALPRNLNGKIDRVAAQDLLKRECVSPPETVRDVVASVLGLPVQAVTGTLAVYSSAAWDSLAHARLMLAIEEEFGICVDHQIAADLNCVADIEALVAGAQRLPAKPVPVARGLAGVLMDRTAISRIDGVGGMLEYRGYPIGDLAAACTTEEVFGLLLDGDIPGQSRAASIDHDLSRAQALPPGLLALVAASAQTDIWSTLAAVLSADPLADALTLAGRTPAVLGAWLAARENRTFEPHSGGPHEIRCFWNIVGRAPGTLQAAVLREAIILHAEHGANASTLTLRTATSAGASLPHAVGAAVMTFGGRRHGGAIADIATIFDAIGSQAEAADYVADHAVVPGFGHRIYSGEDPRASRMRHLASALSDELGDHRDFTIAAALVEAMTPRIRMGVAPNIDLFATVIYRLLGVAPELLAAVPVIGRVVGWCAHAAEQTADNILIRPDLLYDGPDRRQVAC